MTLHTNTTIEAENESILLFNMEQRNSIKLYIWLMKTVQTYDVSSLLY